MSAEVGLFPQLPGSMPTARNIGQDMAKCI